jgi:tetratricopeptide (TPR) repeat protein
VQYFYALDFDKAREQGSVMLDIYPNSVMGRSNYALYAMYSTDFETAVTEAAKVREMDAAYFKAWLPVAIKELSDNDIEAARQAYKNMQPAGIRGQLTGQIGLADAAMYAGEFDKARALFTEGVALAQDAGSSYFEATMRIGLSEALLREGADDAAVSKALLETLDTSGGLSRQVPAALMYVEIGDVQSARLIEAALSKVLQPQSRAYATVINAMIALRDGDTVTAIDSISAGIELADLWLLRFYRGIAYLEAGYGAEALDEFTACYERRGEASAVFLDDLPTYRYAATLPYWKGRAQQAIGMTHDAKQSFMTFIAARPEGDALAEDARERMR